MRELKELPQLECHVIGLLSISPITTKLLYGRISGLSHTRIRPRQTIQKSLPNGAPPTCSFGSQLSIVPNATFLF
jgi:hypothetical protein